MIALLRALALAALTSGCAFHSTIQSTPAGAQLTLPDGTTATTPAEVRLKWGPFTRRRVTATAVGYRTVTIDLRKAREIELVLVPEHDSVGTWTQDEVP